MNANQVRLSDAGIREQEYANQLICEGKLPRDISYKDFLDHGVYDTSRDEITLTVKAVVYTFKVERG